MENHKQISIFDLIQEQKIPENQNEQTKQKTYDRCDYCNMPCCYGCKYLEEEVKDNV